MMFSIGFLAGVLVLLALPALPGAVVLWGMAVVASVVGGWVALAAPRRTAGVTIVIGLAVGFLYTAIHAHLYLRDRWPVDKSDDRVIATVIIDTIPAVQGGSRSFDGIVTIESPSPLPSARPLRVRLIARAPDFTPHVGERWRLLLTLRAPRAKVNPGTPDAERTLFHDRVHALGTVVPSSLNHRIDTGHRSLDAFREQIAAHIDARVADRDASALICALAVGVTGAMSREQWRVFNATGTTHLVAISGMHVTLFAVVMFAVARKLWSVALYRFIPWRREDFAAVIGFMAAAVYATLAGLSVPTQRTLIMLGVWLFTRSVARTSPPFHSFALALIVVLLLDPFAPLTAGFWLSFGAMAAIILATSTHFTRRPMLLEALAVQSVVTVALIPLTLGAFGSVSLVGPLVNAVAIPAMSWIFVPTILLSLMLAPISAWASDAVLALAAGMHDAAWPWLAEAADVPWALIHASPPAWWYALAALGVLLALMPWPVLLRLAILLGVMPLAAAVDSSPPQRAADVTILDAGEGTAIVVQTAGHVLVYETGDAYGTDGRVAESVLIPYLRSRGLHRIDTLIAGRVTAATSQGITALLVELPVSKTLVSGNALPDFSGAQRCVAGYSWQWDGVSFEVMPLEGSSGCALRVGAGGSVVFIPGDPDARAEVALTHTRDIKARIVVVPRHGSDAASSQTFVEAVHAHWAVVTGRRERDGREKAAVRRWREAGATVLATGDQGAIAFRLDDMRGVEGPRLTREQDRTLWRSSP